MGNKKAIKYARTAAKRLVQNDMLRGCKVRDWYQVEVAYIEELIPYAQKEIDQGVRAVLIPVRIHKEYLNG